MKKTICIDPADQEMETMAKSVEILNRFKILGISIRKKFVDLVIEQDATFSNHQDIKDLYSFWVGRTRDQKLNGRLEKVLEIMTGNLEEKVNRLKAQL